MKISIIYFILKNLLWIAKSWPFLLNLFVKTFFILGGIHQLWNRPIWGVYNRVSYKSFSSIAKLKKIRFQYKTTLCYIKNEKFKNHSLSLFLFWTENSFHQNSKVFIFTDSVFLLFNKESIDVLCLFLTNRLKLLNVSVPYSASTSRGAWSWLNVFIYPHMVFIKYVPVSLSLAICLMWLTSWENSCNQRS